MSRRARRGRRPGATGLLALACAALLAVIYLELDDPPLSRAARSMPSDAAAGETPAGEWTTDDIGVDMPPLAVYAEIAARPLFSPSRRPPPAEEAAPEPEEPPARRDQLLLRGVALADDSRVALIERRATGEIVRALEGQSVDGWRVVTVTPGAVVLEGREDTYTLEVERDASPPAVAERVRRQRSRPVEPRHVRPGEEVSPGPDEGTSTDVEREEDERSDGAEPSPGALTLPRANAG